MSDLNTVSCIGSGSSCAADMDKEYVASTYNRFPVTITGGKGSVAYSSDGREYIDLGSGIAVNSFGFCDEQWAQAVEAQLRRVQHTSNLYYTEPCARLAEGLCIRTGMKKVFFANSGAEANEGAIKAARKYSHDKYGDGRSTIITMKNSFHGRTIATLAATGQDSFHKDFGPFPAGFSYCEPDDPENFFELCRTETPAAVMFEVVQGEGGVKPLDREFIRAVCDYANNNDILVIVDEVQTGNGRTGALYGYMNYGIIPDIVTTAKGLGGGLPIGAVMLGEKVKGVFTPGTHGSTFGGNPIACAGALSILERIDDCLLCEVRKKSKYIFDSLSAADGVLSVSGMGLMIGVETVKPVSQVISGCLERGLLVLSAKSRVRLLPALNIPYELLEKGINILKEVIST